MTSTQRRQPPPSRRSSRRRRRRHRRPSNVTIAGIVVMVLSVPFVLGMLGTGNAGIGRIFLVIGGTVALVDHTGTTARRRSRRRSSSRRSGRSRRSRSSGSSGRSGSAGRSHRPPPDFQAPIEVIDLRPKADVAAAPAPSVPASPAAADAPAVTPAAPPSVSMSAQRTVRRRRPGPR